MNEIITFIKKYRNYIIIGIIAIYAVFATITAVTSTVRANKSGRLCNELREQLTNATDTNRGLAATIGECQSICDNLKSTTESSIGTARQAIEQIEQLRVEIQELEDCVYGSNSGYDYDYWDNYLGLN